MIGHLTSETAPAPLPEDEIAAYLALPALQQPDWGDPWLAAKVRADLAVCTALVVWDEVRTLRSLLAEAAVGRMLIVQAGDCAEDPADCGPATVERKVDQLDALAGLLQLRTGMPVIRVGRIAGQFAKPRSRPTERVGGVELPAFRGMMVNSPEPHLAARRADPLRLLTGHLSAAETVAHLRREPGSWTPAPSPALWTSHEALLLDYELPQLRRLGDGRLLLSSTHWPWIGERTRQPDNAHVRMLADVANPVACKVGPECRPEELLQLCALLDPWREPGRLTLVARFGSERALTGMPPLVSAVRKAGHPVIWMCDPMHGNTITAPHGLKTRLMTTMSREIDAFLRAVRSAGSVAGGLHLETTPDAVAECAADEADTVVVGRRAPYQSLCDPRLNSGQALDLVSTWRP